MSVTPKPSLVTPILQLPAVHGAPAPVPRAPLTWNASTLAAAIVSGAISQVGARLKQALD